MELYNKNEFINLLKNTFSVLKYQDNNNKIIYLLNKTIQNEKDFNSAQCELINYLNVTKHIIANFNKTHNLNLILTLDRFYTVYSNDNGGHLLQQKLIKSKNRIINKNKKKNRIISPLISKKKNKEIKTNLPSKTKRKLEFEDKHKIKSDEKYLELFKLIENLQI